MSDPDYLTVREVMTPDPIVIDGLATVQTAVDLIRESGVSSLVVQRRYKGDEYGIIVMHDIAEHIVARDASPDRTNVYQVMAKPVVSLDADMNVKYAIRLLFRFNLSRGLVLEQGELIGIVTLRELVLAHLAPGSGA